MLMTAELWEQQSGETARAYKAFVTYRDLGAERSIDRAYVALSSKRQRNGSETAAKAAPRHWYEWSSNNEWVRRAQAWDREQQRQADETRELLKRNRIAELIEDEFADYRAELARFRRVRDQTPAYEREAMKETTETKDDENGKPMRVIVRIHTARLNVGSHRGLTRWRKNISELGRLSVGLPTSFTASKVDAKVEGSMTWKQMVEEARGDDESDDEADPDAS